MSECWECKQKAAYKAERLTAARAAAKLQANEQGETMAIIKEGCNYRIILASEAVDTRVFEYISKHQ